MNRSTIGHPTRRPEPIDPDVARGMLEQARDFRLDHLAELRRSVRSSRVQGVEREINESLAAGARAALRDVLDALSRLDAGTYGVCLGCGGAVETERLQIVPQTARCSACQRAVA